MLGRPSRELFGGARTERKHAKFGADVELELGRSGVLRVGGDYAHAVDCAEVDLAVFSIPQANKRSEKTWDEEARASGPCGQGWDFLTKTNPVNNY